MKNFLLVAAISLTSITTGIAAEITFTPGNALQDHKVNLSVIDNNTNVTTEIFQNEYLKKKIISLENGDYTVTGELIGLGETAKCSLKDQDFTKTKTIKMNAGYNEHSRKWRCSLLDSSK